MATASDVPADSTWQQQLETLINRAPADSVVYIVVFVRSADKPTFQSWASERNVPVEHEFTSFSGFSIRPTVSQLATMLDIQDSITGIDWGTSSIEALCT